MASCGHGTTNPSRTREACRASGKRLSWGIIAEAGGGACVCTDPYLVPYPDHGEPLGTRHIPSLLLVRIPYGGQSKWQAGRWAMSSPFLSCKFLARRRPLGLHLSCSRLRCRDWSDPGTVPFATSLGQSRLCIAPSFYPAETCAPEPFPGLARPKGARHVRTALVTLLVQIPPALHAS